MCREGWAWAGGGRRCGGLSGVGPASAIAPRACSRRLSYNHDLKDEGVAALLAGLEVNAALVELDLTQCGVGPSTRAGLQALASNRPTLVLKI